jgi:hypothetical protein
MLTCSKKSLVPQFESLVEMMVEKSVLASTTQSLLVWDAGVH